MLRRRRPASDPSTYTSVRLLFNDFTFVEIGATAFRRPIPVKLLSSVKYTRDRRCSRPETKARDRASTAATAPCPLSVSPASSHAHRDCAPSDHTTREPSSEIGVPPDLLIVAIGSTQNQFRQRLEPFTGRPRASTLTSESCPADHSYKPPSIAGHFRQADTIRLAGSHASDPVSHLRKVTPPFHAGIVLLLPVCFTPNSVPRARWRILRPGAAFRRRGGTPGDQRAVTRRY